MLLLRVTFSRAVDRLLASTDSVTHIMDPGVDDEKDLKMEHVLPVPCCVLLAACLHVSGSQLDPSLLIHCHTLLVNSGC